MYELSEGIGSQLINMDKEATGVQGWKRRGGKRGARVGVGGMGAVHLARHTYTEQGRRRLLSLSQTAIDCH